MTSSLVGSEMCIRDRPNDIVKEFQATFDGIGGPETPLIVIKRAAFIPVSYTHLTLPTICSV
eukprot:2538858-Prorocentrum_lima.AAC.1